MQTLSIMVTHAELSELRNGNMPARIGTALAHAAMKADPVDEVEIVAVRNGMALYWHGVRLGNANRYTRDGCEYWQVNLAPGYQRSIRRNSFPRLIEAVQEWALNNKPELAAEVEGKRDDARNA